MLKSVNVWKGTSKIKKFFLLFPQAFFVIVFPFFVFFIIIGLFISFIFSAFTAIIIVIIKGINWYNFIKNTHDRKLSDEFNILNKREAKNQFYEIKIK